MYFKFTRRPFANNPRVPRGHQNGYGYPANGFIDQGGHHGMETVSVVDHLRKKQVHNEDDFMEKIKEWETNSQQK